ncbi:MAG: fibronectin type III domain-containing protein, partial [bacterium]
VVAAVIASPGTTHQDAGLAPVTTYYYKVTARDTSLNESAASGEVNQRPVDSLAPAAPGTPTVADVPSDQGFALRLNWTLNAETDVREYGVYRSTNAGVTQVSSHVVTLVLSPGTTREDGGLTNGATYYYKLSARDTSGNESGLSTEASAIPYDNLAPAAPTGLGLVDPGTTVLNLTWTASTELDLKDYRVYRSTNAGVTIVSSHVLTAVSAPGTTHQDAGLTVGTRYYFRITARDVSLNESGDSSEVSGVPGAPATPTGLGVADVASDQGVALNLSWGADTEADLKDYRVHRSTNGNVTVASSWTVVAAVVAQPGTTHQDAGLTPATTYYFKVTARDTSLNESPASSEVNLRPVDNSSPTAPGAPTVADVPSDQGFALQLNWSLNTETDVREYGVYRSTNGNITIGSSWTVLVTLVLSPGTTRQDGGLTNAATYYYRLSARDTCGNESGLSPEASAIPYDNLAPA